MSATAPHSASGSFGIRTAVESDIPRLLPLMLGLAEYEGYADRFAVTAQVLRDQGFRRSPPDFHCVVAEDANGTLVGMAVYFIIAFTFAARPTLYLKELFVAPGSRGGRIGERLLGAVAREATRRGCGAVRWQVARWNTHAMRFYERLGASPDDEWVDYQLSNESLQALASRGEPRE